MSTRSPRKGTASARSRRALAGALGKRAVGADHATTTGRLVDLEEDDAGEAGRAGETSP